jgi:hypothetical protein
METSLVSDSAQETVNGIVQNKWKMQGIVCLRPSLLAVITKIETI